MFTGSLLDNLDPFRERSEREVWKALETVRSHVVRQPMIPSALRQQSHAMRYRFICRCGWQTGHAAKGVLPVSSLGCQKGTHIALTTC